MISKEKFVEFLAKYKDLDLKETRLNEALSDYCGEPTLIYGGGLGLALDVLAEAMGDHEDLIVSFIYDANYGECETPHYVVNGKGHIIKTPEALYDVLTGND